MSKIIEKMLDDAQAKISYIQNSDIYKQVLSDSFGGIMYDVANFGKYDGQESEKLISLWDSLNDGQRSLAGGIMKGAIEFLKGE